MWCVFGHEPPETASRSILVLGIAVVAVIALHYGVLRYSVYPSFIELEHAEATRNLERVQNVISAELIDPNVPNERRALLAQYVNGAVTGVAEQHQETRAELEAMSQQISKLEAILAEQDAASRSENILEAVALMETLEPAIAAIPRQTERAVDIEADANLSDTDDVLAHRFLLKQVLINVLTNAAESIEASGSRAGEIKIAAHPETVDERQMICLSISDNGAGIEPDDLEAVFRRGYSTKVGSKSGLGLHWCANTIAAMNGDISATSEGLGRGATFRIRLPVPPAQPARHNR